MSMPNFFSIVMAQRYCRTDKSVNAVAAVSLDFLLHDYIQPSEKSHFQMLAN
jgi:hypothetical protein